MIGGGAPSQAKVTWLTVGRAWGGNGTHHCGFSEKSTLYKTSKLADSVQSQPYKSYKIKPFQVHGQTEAFPWPPTRSWSWPTTRRSWPPTRSWSPPRSWSPTRSWSSAPTQLEPRSRKCLEELLRTRRLAAPPQLEASQGTTCGTRGYEKILPDGRFDGRTYMIFFQKYFLSFSPHGIQLLECTPNSFTVNKIVACTKLYSYKSRPRGLLD